MAWPYEALVPYCNLWTGHEVVTTTPLCQTVTGSDAHPAGALTASARAFSSPVLVTFSAIVTTTIDTTHIQYHHLRRTIAISTDIQQRLCILTTNYIEQRHLDSANDNSSLLGVRFSTLNLVLFAPNSLHRSWTAYCSQPAATTLGFVHILSRTWPNPADDVSCTRKVKFQYCILFTPTDLQQHCIFKTYCEEVTTQDTR